MWIKKSNNRAKDNSPNDLDLIYFGRSLSNSILCDLCSFMAHILGASTGWWWGRRSNIAKSKTAANYCVALVVNTALCSLYPPMLDSTSTTLKGPRCFRRLVNLILYTSARSRGAQGAGPSCINRHSIIWSRVPGWKYRSIMTGSRICPPSSIQGITTIHCIYCKPSKCCYPNS